MGPMNAFVLFVGVATFEQYRYHRTMLKDGLHGMHMGWSVNSGSREELDQALTRTQDWENLDVVFVVGEGKYSQAQMLEEAAKLAKQMSEDPRKPWVSFYAELNYLRPVFEAEGVYVAQGFGCHVVQDRWESRQRAA